MDDFLKEESQIKIKVSAGEGSAANFATLGLPAQYEIIEEIGRGGMGTVYKARHRQLGTYVAIKVINPNLLEGKNETKDNAQKRFINESKAVSQLQQENLIALKDFGVTEAGLLFMVMEYAEGKTLELMLKDGPLEPKSALNMMRGICDGLEHAHALGLVHRDIKPSNIIISKSAAGREVPKLLDFGIARITGDDGKTQGLTSTGEVFGSPYCIAPEQSLSSKVDRRADIYSLGCVLFECVSGKPPFAGDTAMQTIMMHLNAPVPSASSALGKPLPSDLEFIINRCLQKDPGKRYQSAASLKADIDLLLAGKRLRRTALAPAAPKKNVRAVIVVAIVGLAVAIAGQVFAVMLLKSHSGEQETTKTSTSFNTSAGASLESAAYNADMGDAFAAFNRGDYNRCIILQKGAIGVYDDRLEDIATAITKGAGEADLKKLRANENRLLALKAENLKHVGDCYRLMSKDESALSYYQKGLDIFRRWAFTGYRSTDMDECFRYAIEILQKLGRSDQAQTLQLEYDKSVQSKAPINH